MKKRLLVCTLFLGMLLGFAFVPGVLAEIKINEVELNPSGSDSGNEFIELINLDPENPVNLSGWYLQDRDGNNFTLPGIFIEYFFVLDGLTGFVNSEENVSLFNPENFVEDEALLLSDGSNNDLTNQRLPDGTGSFVFKSETEGRANEEVLIKDKGVSDLCVFPGENVTLGVNVTGFCVEEIVFFVEVNGSNQNFTGENVFGDIYETGLRGDLFGNKTDVNWTVYVRDCLGNWTVNGLESFHVNSRTSLSVSPNNPDGTNGWYVSEPGFILENTDASQIFYRWNGFTRQTYSGQFNLDNTPDNGKTRGGKLDLHYWADASCGEEDETRTVFFVDLLDPVIEDLVPGNGSNVNEISEISVYVNNVHADLSSGLDNGSIGLWLNGQVASFDLIAQPGQDLIVRHNPAGLADGVYEVVLNVSDNAGRNSRATWNFTLGQASMFNLNILSPASSVVYDTRRVLLDVNLSSDAKRLEYIDNADRRPRLRRLCSNCDSYSRLRSFSEGEHNLTIIATDEFGNKEQGEVYFVVDSRKPRIHSISPRNRGLLQGLGEFEVRYTESNLQEVKLVVNGSDEHVLSCDSGARQECSIEINLEDFHGKTTEYYFVVSDENHEVISRTYEFSVDAVAPVLQVFAPEDIIYLTNRVPFNLTADSRVKALQFMDLSTSKPRWSRLCSNCESYGFLRKRSKFLRDGNHDLLIRAVDAAGNEDVKAVSLSVA